LTQIDRIIARHQLSDGRGSVIAYQLENEFYNGDENGRTYLQHLREKAIADGITVPLVGNHNDTFVSGKGAMDVTGWDYYSQGFDCSHPAQWKPVPDMAKHRHPGQPLFTAEYQGGAFDPWGGPGYAQCAKLINDRFANVFYKENIAAGATAQNFYMTYGGTSWGWQAIPRTTPPMTMAPPSPRRASSIPNITRTSGSVIWSRHCPRSWRRTIWRRG
jgi:beta-galactosidase GanA